MFRDKTIWVVWFIPWFLILGFVTFRWTIGQLILSLDSRDYFDALQSTDS